MSVKSEVYFATVPEWLLYSDISATAIRLYAVLNRYANEKHTAHPSRRALAEKMRCSKATVDRAIKDLEDAGALEVIERFREGGDGQTSNEYRLLVRGPQESRGGRAGDEGGSPKDDEGPLLTGDEPKNQSQLEPEPKEPEKTLPFAEFWIAYPSRNGIKGSRKTALAVWKTLTAEKQAAAFAALPIYAKAAAGYPKDAERYLKHEMWDGLDPGNVGKNGVGYKPYENADEWTPEERGVKP